MSPAPCLVSWPHSIPPCSVGSFVSTTKLWPCGAGSCVWKRATSALNGVAQPASASAAPVMAAKPSRRKFILLMVMLRDSVRSEEHTSELQSLMRISYAVFCLKTKKYAYQTHIILLHA